MKDAHHRSILKAISWRICATITTMIIFYVLTGRLALALGAGGIEVVVKMFLYYVHERAWGRIKIGRKLHPLSELQIDKPLTEEDMEIVKQKLKDLGYISED